MAKFRVYLDKLELCPKNLSSTNSFGEYKSYHPNGQLNIICTYIDDKQNGEYKSHWDNGQLWGNAFYIDDKRNGEYKVYNKNGSLYLICSYVDDKKVE